MPVAAKPRPSPCDAMLAGFDPRIVASERERWHSYGLVCDHEFVKHVRLLVAGDLDRCRSQAWAIANESIPGKRRETVRGKDRLIRIHWSPEVVSPRTPDPAMAARWAGVCPWGQDREGGTGRVMTRDPARRFGGSADRGMLADDAGCDAG